MLAFTAKQVTCYYGASTLYALFEQPVLFLGVRDGGCLLCVLVEGKVTCVQATFTIGALARFPFKTFYFYFVNAYLDSGSAC